MSIFERLMAALKRYRLRDEAGAGGLLPIITVGMMVVIVAASIAGATTFAAKISGQQTTQVKVDMEVKSMLAVATAELSSTVTPEPVITVTGSGRYSLYWSASDTAPATDTSPGVKALVKGNQVPVDTKWIVMRMRPLSQNTDVKFAVFRYYPQKSQVLDNAIRWNGGVNFINSEISLGTGSSGVHSLALQNTGSSSRLLLQNSTINADIYADFPGQIEVIGGTLHGSVLSKSGITMGGTTKPVILGDALSGGTIYGSGDVAGTQQANRAVDLSPVLPLQSYNLTLSSAPAYIMKAEDCSTPDRLKSKIESYTSPIVITGVGVCASTSWKVEVKPKANIMLYHGSSLTVDGFKVTNSQGTVGFASGGTLTLKNTVYSVGAVGYFVSRGAMLISNSDLTGGISGYGSAPGSLLDISNSKFSYSPVTAPLLNFTSASPHIVRVS